MNYLEKIQQIEGQDCKFHSDSLQNEGGDDVYFVQTSTEKTYACNTRTGEIMDVTGRVMVKEFNKFYRKPTTKDPWDGVKLGGEVEYADYAYERLDRLYTGTYGKAHGNWGYVIFEDGTGMHFTSQLDGEKGILIQSCNVKEINEAYNQDYTRNGETGYSPCGAYERFVLSKPEPGLYLYENGEFTKKDSK